MTPRPATARATREPAGPAAPEREATPATVAGSLSALATRYGSDKWGAHKYTPHYEVHLGRYRDRPIKLLEIGIGGYQDPTEGGSSLKMWAQYFPLAEIVGLDIFDKRACGGERITIYQGDQSDAKTLREISDQAGPFDIVIDDGSHENRHVLASFEILFPLLRRGGLYVVEDTQTAYWRYFGGSPTDLDGTQTSMGFFKSLIHGLSHREIPRPGYTPTYYDKNIRGMHFYHNLVFVDKDANEDESNILSNYQFPANFALFGELPKPIAPAASGAPPKSAKAPRKPTKTAGAPKRDAPKKGGKPAK